MNYSCLEPQTDAIAFFEVAQAVSVDLLGSCSWAQSGMFHIRACSWFFENDQFELDGFSPYFTRVFLSQQVSCKLIPKKLSTDS